MAKSEFNYLSADQKTQIRAVCWSPDFALEQTSPHTSDPIPLDHSPKAIVQLTHGMVEFIDRYDGFADYLTGQGFVVFGHDHLGHGGSVQSTADWGHFADEHGFDFVLQDIQQLTHLARRQYPGLPVVLMGHSMGSFFTRCYLTEFAEEIDAVILSGTGQQSLVELAFGQALASMIRLAKGPRHRSLFVDGLAFGRLNKSFAGGRTSRDWLTRDEAIVDFHLSDPRCNFVFSVTAYRDMFRCYQLAQDPARLKKIPRDKPVLFVAGDKDPVSGFGRGTTAAWKQLRQLGFANAQIKLYPDYRHEILNEIGKEKVYDDIAQWIKSVNSKTSI